jgi:hypothetical protein
MIRRFLPGLGVALTVALFAAQPVRASEPDKLLPPECDSVISLNIRQVVDSDIIKKYALEQMKQALAGNDARKFLGDLGLDPLKDIDRVVIGGSGKDATDMKYLVIVHGKFDPEKLYKAAQAQTQKDPDHFSLVRDGQDKMFKFQPDNDNPVYGTVVDEGTIVMANDKKGVSAALAASLSGKKPVINRDLATLIAKQDDKASLWMAMVLKGKLDDVRLPNAPGVNPALKDHLAKLDTATVVLKVNTDITLDIGMMLPDAEAAMGMGEAVGEILQSIKGLVPFLTAQNPQMKPLADVVKTLKSEVKDKSVLISAKLTGAALGQMLKPMDE